MTGKLTIIGLGPGAPELVTPAAASALAEATDIVGYGPYVDRVPFREGQRRHSSDNREELNRSRHALQMTSQGRKVAVVSSGDAGVFAMAAAIFEAVDLGDRAWRDLEIEVVPGVSAMFAVASAVGAPLGHDFCAISLSNNLKPWSVILDRLHAAAKADFVISLYNAASKTRPDHLAQAFDVFRKYRTGDTPVIFASAVSHPDQKIDVVSLKDADPSRADMRTLVMIGSSMTSIISRPEKASWVYTPRFRKMDLA